VHLDVLWEIPREDLSYEEAIVERSKRMNFGIYLPSNVLYGVGEVKGLDPLKDFTGEA